MNASRKLFADWCSFIFNRRIPILLAAYLIVGYSSPTFTASFQRRNENQNRDGDSSKGSNDVDSNQNNHSNPKDRYTRFFHENLRPGILGSVQMATDIYAPLYKRKVRDLLLPISESDFRNVSIALLEDMVMAIRLSNAVYTKIIDGSALSIGDDGQPDCVAQYDENTKTLWIVSRGTHTAQDILHDATWVQNTSKIGKLDIPMGVVERCKKIAPLLLEHLEVLGIRKNKVERICFVGHSLGGAMAIGLYLSWHLEGTSKNNHNDYSSIPTSVITVGAPLVLSNPPKGFCSLSSSPEGYCDSSQNNENNRNNRNNGNENNGNDRNNGNNRISKESKELGLEKNVHNIVMALDIVPRILGCHPLPVCITGTKLGSQFESFLSGKVHRETYRPYGHFYSLREKEEESDRDLQNIFGVQNVLSRQSEKKDYLIGRELKPELLLSIFPGSVGEIGYSIVRDHKIDDTEKSIEQALRDARKYRSNM